MTAATTMQYLGASAWPQPPARLATWSTCAMANDLVTHEDPSYAQNGIFAGYSSAFVPGVDAEPDDIPGPHACGPGSGVYSVAHGLVYGHWNDIDTYTWNPNPSEPDSSAAVPVVLPIDIREIEAFEPQCVNAQCDMQLLQWTKNNDDPSAGWLPCGSSGADCSNWSNDPAGVAGHYACMWGPYWMALANCATMIPTYNPDTLGEYLNPGAALAIAYAGGWGGDTEKVIDGITIPGLLAGITGWMAGEPWPCDSPDVISQACDPPSTSTTASTTDADPLAGLPVWPTRIALHVADDGTPVIDRFDACLPTNQLCATELADPGAAGLDATDYGPQGMTAEGEMVGYFCIRAEDNPSSWDDLIPLLLDGTARQELWTSCDDVVATLIASIPTGDPTPSTSPSTDPSASATTTAPTETPTPEQSEPPVTVATTVVTPPPSTGATS